MTTEPLDQPGKPAPSARPAGFLGIAWTVVPAVSGILLLTHLGGASQWLEQHEQLGIFIYIALFAIMSGCGMLPTYSQAVLGGWVFGTALGLPAALLGFAGGAAIGYLITRLVAQDRVERLISRHRRASVIRDALIGHGFIPTFGVVALLRLPPNSPFALTNLAMASTGVRPLPYLLGTIVGMAPRTAVAVALAASAAATGARDIQGFVKEQGWIPLIVGVLVILIVAAVIGSIAKRAVDRMDAGSGNRNREDSTGPAGVDGVADPDAAESDPQAVSAAEESVEIPLSEEVDR